MLKAGKNSINSAMNKLRSASAFGGSAAPGSGAESGAAKTPSAQELTNSGSSAMFKKQQAREQKEAVIKTMGAKKKSVSIFNDGAAQA